MRISRQNLIQNMSLERGVLFPNDGPPDTDKQSKLQQGNHVEALPGRMRSQRVSQLDYEEGAKCHTEILARTMS